ncbi:putative endopeptidase precursor [Streptomyces sp. YIM 130001]|uniref:C40 family peptidase n=1 Tax=Streptomyces sp. YIM 130001 TaxID=2259644 RepID=UPI000E65BB0D|nr:NlpC/P60 family protein [Streptomyces sp. YIM 130001]RII18241.1 putative endopeptidase precursor [Streptomyces sp. YIM 130001]
MAFHRRTAHHRGLDRSTRITVVSTAAATVAAAFGAVPAIAEPDGGADATKAKVDRLHTEAERATEAYNKADERADGLRGQVSRLQDRVARGQSRINTMRGALGSLAGSQYRSGGIDPSLALLLSDDPDDYLDKASTLDRITFRQAGELTELQRAQRSLAQERAEAERVLGDLVKARASVARHKRGVKSKLAAAQRLLNSLPASERAAFEDGAGGELAGPSGAAASSRAAAALAAARQAVGRPYVWGANGPSGFDCSGLTQWAYAQAGVSLPRTSQAQRYAGRQVPLGQAQPGDLVAYRDDASHIGMYVGDGQVVHAPHPGASVRYDPVGMMPVSSVTRV